MLLSMGEKADGSKVPVCRGCITAVIEVESLRERVKRMQEDLNTRAKVSVAVSSACRWNPPLCSGPSCNPPPEDDGNISRKSWNKAIKAAAAEAAHNAYDTVDGLNLRIAEAILELKK
jgi:hypothetical protein